MFLSVTLPVFTNGESPCLFANQTLERLALALEEYLKTDFLSKEASAYGTRFPIMANILVKIHRMDARLLSTELQAVATVRHKTVFDKRVYLHFTENASLPLCTKDLVGKHCRCVFVRENTATDPQTGKAYPLRSKYRL